MTSNRTARGTQGARGLSAEAEAVVALRRTAAALDHALSDVLKPSGLTATQYNVLRILRGAGAQGLCGREVGERMIASVPDVPRMLERMAEAGLVAREADPRDRRHTTARITAKGLKLLDALAPAIGGLHRRMMHGVDHEQLRTLTGLLARVQANV